MRVNQHVYLGTDALDCFRDLLLNGTSRKVFLVRGKQSYQACGAKQFMDGIFRFFSCEMMEFYDFEENPKWEDVCHGLDLAESYRPDLFVAVGGGSALDMAKLIRFFYAYSGNPVGKDFVKKSEPVPLWVFPTTAGTGCEATRFAVMYKDKVKYSVEHTDMLPDRAFVYSPFTYHNPAYLTACTGFDALAQAIEAYWNVRATPESDGYAEKAIGLLWHNLPILIEHPTEKVRNQVSEGAYWAGKAINITRTTAPHAFSYAFTTYCEYPHGHAVALTFPFFAKLNCLEAEMGELQEGIDLQFYKKKVARLREMLGIQEKESIGDVFEFYLKRIGLGRKEEFADLTFLLGAVNLQRLGNNPVKMDSMEGTALKNYLSGE